MNDVIHGMTIGGVLLNFIHYYEASSHHRIQMTEFRLDFDQKIAPLKAKNIRHGGQEDPERKIKVCQFHKVCWCQFWSCSIVKVCCCHGSVIFIRSS